MSARIRVYLFLSLALIAGILILLVVSWQVRQAAYPTPGPESGLLVQYFANQERSGLAQNEWIESRTSLEGTSLSPQRANDYSLRLTGLLYISVPGFYEFGTASDDDSWLFLDGLLLVDNRGEHPLQHRMAGVWLAPGPHLIEVEYVQRRGKAALQLWWQPFWSWEPSLLPQDVLKPMARPAGRLELVELGYAARTNWAQAAAILLTIWILLTAGLWPPGGWRRVLALYLAVAPLTIWSILPQVSLDLWCDELVSLAMFSIQPFSVTVSEYPFPNNHIFYNLINNFFLRLIDSHNFSQVISSPFALRLLSLGFSITALAWLYRAMLRHFNLEAAWLATLVLATTLPFASYATQLRGYSLALLLTVILLDLWLRFLKSPTLLLGLAVVLCNVALVWDLPSNVYISASLLLSTIPLVWRPEMRKQVLKAAVWLSGSLILGALFYLPVWDQVVKHGASAGLFRQADILYSLMPKVWGHLLTGRYLLLPGLLFGAWLLARGRIPGGWSALGAVSLLVLPFLFFWAYGSRPYQRVFLMLAVPWAGAAGLLLAAPLKTWAWGRALRWSWLGMIFLICVGSYMWALSGWRNQVETANTTGGVMNNLSYCDHLHQFNPRQTALSVLKEDECNVNRIFLGLDLHDGGTLYEYAKHFGLKLSADTEIVRPIIGQGECLYVAERGSMKAPLLNMGEKAVLKLLNNKNQFYHLYRWGPEPPKESLRGSAN